MRFVLLAWLSLVLVACGGNAGTDAGPPDGSDAGEGDSDAGAPTDAGEGGDAGPGSDAGPGADPFTGAPDTWTYVEVEGARCGNGSVLPVAVNLHEGADRVFLFLQGGGACWDTNTCFILNAASHLQDTLDEPTVLGEASRLDPFLANRDSSVGPFADASFVYVPYCTGDLHSGTNVMSYMTLAGAREVHHVGADNMDLILARLFATVPTPSRVYVGGASAGGYGSALNFWRVRARWPGVRVDVLDDSGTPVEMAPARFNAAVAAWDIELPPGCTDCDGGWPALMPHYAATVTEPHRFAILSFRRDNVISTYFGISQAQFQNRYDALATEMATTTYQRTFSLDGAGHVVLGDASRTTSGGVSAAEWVRQFATDDPGWDSVGP